MQDDNDKIREAKEGLADLNDKLSMELEQLQSSANPQDSLHHKKKMYSDDVQKFQTLIERLQIHKQKMTAKVTEVKLELERRKEESSSFDVEKDRLQVRILLAAVVSPRLLGCSLIFGASVSRSPFSTVKSSHRLTFNG